MSNGIFAQPAESILEDIQDFYFGSIPWIGRRTLSEDKTSIEARMWDPEGDEGDFTTYTLTAEQVTQTFTQLLTANKNLCCKVDIITEQLGYGCAADLDFILQQACYGEQVFG